MIKTTFNKKDLLKAIDCCNSSIEKKGTMPILTNILFDIKGSNALLNSMNYETSTVVNIDAKNETGEEAKIAVPAKFMYDICKLSKSEEIHIEYDTNEETSSMQISITAGKSNFMSKGWTFRITLRICFRDRVKVRNGLQDISGGRS